MGLCFPQFGESCGTGASWNSHSKFSPKKLWVKATLMSSYAGFLLCSWNRVWAVLAGGAVRRSNMITGMLSSLSFSAAAMISLFSFPVSPVVHSPKLSVMKRIRLVHFVISRCLCIMQRRLRQHSSNTISKAVWDGAKDFKTITSGGHQTSFPPSYKQAS